MASCNPLQISKTDFIPSDERPAAWAAARSASLRFPFMSHPFEWLRRFTIRGFRIRPGHFPLFPAYEFDPAVRAREYRLDACTHRPCQIVLRRKQHQRVAALVPRASVPDAIEWQTFMSEFRPNEFRHHLRRDVFDMSATVPRDRHRRRCQTKMD